MTRKIWVVLALLGLAGSASASNQAPHDFARAVTCNSCHVPFAGMTDPQHWYVQSGTQEATRLVIAGATFAPGQWEGGVVTFTSGQNRNEYREITANDATSVSWAEPLPIAEPLEVVSFQINKLTYDDVELKCKACHNPTGPVPGEVGLHLTGSAGAIGCGKCHDPHNTAPNSGWSGSGGGALVRAEIRLPQGGTDPVSYDPAGGAGRLVTAGGDGVCQVCHTRTAYYRNDGSLQTHEVGNDCSTCHGHRLGFGGGAYASGHFDDLSPAWEDHGWSQGCLRCHTQGGFKDYIGESDGIPNYLSGSFNTDATTSAWGAMTCTTCHNAVADPSAGTLTQVLFPSLSRVTTNSTVALCAQCHQARESTASLSSKITSNVAAARRGLGLVSSSANAAGTTTTVVRTGSTWAADAFRGYTLLFTTGLNKDVSVTVTGNTATQITFAPAVASPTASGHAFTMRPTATGGTTTTLVDTGRAWTVDQWVGFYVFFQTGNGKGLHRQVTANTATTLTFAGAQATATAAGDQYQILPTEDTAVADAQLASANSFTNSHYFGAAATLMGGEVYGWYQYPRTNNGVDRYAVYTERNWHGVSAAKCSSCHNPHTLEVVVNAETCGRCHFTESGEPIANMVELEEIRQWGFQGDIDGNGLAESLKAEIEGLEAKLYAGVRAYSTNVAGTPLCYNQAGYPYVFRDNGTGGGIAGNGVCEPGESVSANAYNQFTPRLLRAMYNYNLAKHEPGRWAHNPRYVIEVLYDGVIDLNAGLVARGFAPVPFSGRRAFGGHFGAASDESPAGGEAFRDWDSGVVSSSCAQCHDGERGLENYLANPVTALTARPVNGMQCTTCHDPLETDTDMTRMRDISAYGAVGNGVRFPPRSSLVPAPIVKTAADFLDPLDMICSTCHSGREGGASVTARIGVKTDASWDISFPNPHYKGAAAMLFGTETKMGYEYTGKTYAGRKLHAGAQASCVGCHDPRTTGHTFHIAEAAPRSCASAGCHATANYRAYKAVAHDGSLSFDGHYEPAIETLGVQVQHISERLLAAIQAYASANAPATVGPVCYDAHAHPYWFKDNGLGGGVAGNGTCEAGEAVSANGYAFNPTLLRAAFNYQWSQKEPGAWAHNFDYVVQLLYDSIENVGGDVTGLIRPVTSP